MEVRKLKNNELTHHGIKGQKWGIRNGPPYPIEDTTLKKGTKLNTVTMGRRDKPESIFKLNSENYLKIKGYKKEWTYTYNNDYDQKVYKGPFAKYLVFYKGAQYIYEHEFEVVKDLKMPTKKQRIDEFIEVYKNNEDVVKNELKNIQQICINQKIGNKDEQKAYKKFNANKFDINNEQQLNVAYDLFNHMMENIGTSKTAQLYKEQIEKKFDAMVDDNNQGTYNDAKDPIVVFRAEEVLRSISTQPLTTKEINENTEEIRNELKKKGMNVKL